MSDLERAEAILHRRLEEFDERLRQWSKAYPADVFPRPPWPVVDSILTANGLSLASVSAANMHHVISKLDELFEPVRWALAGIQLHRSAPSTKQNDDCCGH